MSADAPPPSASAADADLERLRAELAQKTEEVCVLRQVSSRINATLDAEAIYDIVLGTMDELFGFRHSFILLLDEGGTSLTVVASRGFAEPARGAKVAVGTGIVGIVAQRKKLMRIGNLRGRRAYMDAVRREVARSDAAARLGDAPELPGLPDAENQIAIPLLINDRLIGVFSVETAERAVFSERDENLATIVANLAASAIHNAQLYARLEGAVEQRTRELEQTHRELDVVKELRAKEAPRHPFEDLVGESRAMREARALLRKVATSPSSTILITGENGTGKDLAAKIIHSNSARAGAPFMNITCSALPESLLETELFGHERGAFTDAAKEKRGLFELADGGTVFLDEIGEMSVLLQAKLLRFLEEKAFRRVGGSKDIRVDVRIVAATNRDLPSMVREGRFREDLYYRLRVLPVELPPLRARQGDIPALAQRFVSQFRREFGKDVRGLAPDAVARLEAYAWPGNVRELRNAVERAVLLAERPLLGPEDFPAASGHHEEGADLFQLPPAGIRFEELERALVRAALERTGYNKARAARLLGMPRDWLRYRIEKFGLEDH